MITAAQWAGDLLRELGAPVSFSNMAFLSAWAFGEDTKARFNPLATTWAMPGDSDFNSFGPGDAFHVRNYADYADGLTATVRTLHDGHYPAIVEALVDGDPRFTPEVLAELDTWGTGGEHVRSILQPGFNIGWPPPSLRDVNEGPEPVPVPPAPPAPIAEDDSMIVVTDHGTGYLLSGGWFFPLSPESLKNALGATNPPEEHWTIMSTDVPKSRIVTN